jgi:prophage antirepressor-like protein
MVITPKTTNVNGIQVRHVYKHKCHWVVTADIASSMSISTSTLMRFVTPISDDACQILVGASRARAIRLDILNSALANLLGNSKWQQKLAGDSNLDMAIKQVVAFLEELGQPEPVKTKTSKESSTDAKEVITATVVDFMGHKIRVIEHNERRKWVAGDVIAMLHHDAERHSYSNYLKAVSDEWKSTELIVTPGGVQKVTTIYDPGLYQLIARSNSAIAKQLQRYIFESMSIEALEPQKNTTDTSTNTTEQSATNTNPDTTNETIGVNTIINNQLVRCVYKDKSNWVLSTDSATKEYYDAKPRILTYMEHTIRFLKVYIIECTECEVANKMHPNFDENKYRMEWVKNDIMATLHPYMDKNDYDEYLSQICPQNNQYKRELETDDNIHELVTIDEVTITAIFENSQSPIVPDLCQWVLGKSIPYNPLSNLIDAAKYSCDIAIPTDFDLMGYNIRLISNGKNLEWIGSDAIAMLYPDAPQSSYKGYLGSQGN